MITWTKATITPDPNNACFLAVSDVRGDRWAYTLGFYLPKNCEFKKPDGTILKIFDGGYFRYDPNTNKLQAINNVKYWTCINNPSDINDELIIMKEN